MESITLRKSKVTRNFVMYEGEKGTAVENLYVNQSVLPAPHPDEITVTLSF